MPPPGWCLERDVVSSGVVVDQPSAYAKCSSDFGLCVRDAELPYRLNQLEAGLGTNVVFVGGQ